MGRRAGGRGLAVVCVGGWGERAGQVCSSRLVDWAATAVLRSRSECARLNSCTMRVVWCALPYLALCIIRFSEHDARVAMLRLRWDAAGCSILQLLLCPLRSAPSHGWLGLCM